MYTKYRSNSTKIEPYLSIQHHSPHPGPLLKEREPGRYKAGILVL